MQFRIVLDVDHNIRSTADLHSWASDFQVPQPSWSAITRESGRGHLGYEIEVPVAKHNHARSGPLRLAAALEDGLARKLNADFGYAGLICKNPRHPYWHTVIGRIRAYDLGELADWVDLSEYSGKKAREPQGSLGRNCLLFDRLRMWSYANLRAFKGVTTYDAWADAVAAKAAEFNHYHQADVQKKDPLAGSEVRATATSVAKWTWLHFGEGKAHIDFVAKQRYRQTLQAAAQHAKTEELVKRGIAELINEGSAPTLRNVARRIHKSASTLSAHYGHLFGGWS